MEAEFSLFLREGIKLLMKRKTVKYGISEKTGKSKLCTYMLVASIADFLLYICWK